MKFFQVEESGTPKVLMLSDKAVLKIKEFMMYKRSEILENRKKWIGFLMVKGRKKATGALDTGNGARCCLGHGCFILGIGKTMSHVGGGWQYDGSSGVAPESFINMVGLWDNTGSTHDLSTIDLIKNSEFDLTDLAGVNDDTSASPLRIGRYLLSVIEGGQNTPFQPLTDYPE